MNRESVSVVIPMYNAENTIEKVLASIENQTAKEIIDKVIVVDDGSEDDSKERVENYIRNSTLHIELVCKENGGVSSARNVGMSKVGNAEWIAFCDSDDLWYPNKLERQLSVIEAEKTIDCLGSQVGEKRLCIGLKKITSLHKGTVREICIKNYPQPSTVVMRTKIYESLGGFDENQRYAEDGNYFLHVAAKFNLYFLPEVLINYGFGKRGFGESGLSGNLKGMYEGNVKNLREIHSEKLIDGGFYLLMRVYYYMKYIRRCILTKISGKKR